MNQFNLCLLWVMPTVYSCIKVERFNNLNICIKSYFSEDLINEVAAKDTALYPNREHCVELEYNCGQCNMVVRNFVYAHYYVTTFEI